MFAVEDDTAQRVPSDDIEFDEEAVKAAEAALLLNQVGPAADVDTSVIFAEPAHLQVLGAANGETEMPTNQLIRFLVGVRNRGKMAIALDGVQGSFRYPMDFSYHIQNFTMWRYRSEVVPGGEATLEYAFQVMRARTKLRVFCLDVSGGKMSKFLSRIIYSELKNTRHDFYGK